MKFDLLNNAHSFIENNECIEITAPAKTDYFIDISSDYTMLNAPFYNTTNEGDFIYRCRVRPEFAETYDAGGILVFDSQNKWIKFAFEKTDLGYNSVVSVITNNVSDDCNGEIIDDESIWMQVVRKGHNWCLHYSEDAIHWKMVRYFRLGMNDKIKVGIFSQSPLGAGCKVSFNSVSLLKNTYNNIRKAE